MIQSRKKFLTLHLNLGVLGASDSSLCNVETRGAVEQHHTEWCRRRSFFIVTVDRNTIETRSMEQQSLQLVRISYVLSVHAQVEVCVPW